jgi:hypothetical protein
MSKPTKEPTEKSVKPKEFTAEEIAALEAEKAEILASVMAMSAPKHVAPVLQPTIATGEPAPAEAKATGLGGHTAELAARAKAAKVTAEADAAERTAASQDQPAPHQDPGTARRARPAR